MYVVIKGVIGNEMPVICVDAGGVSELTGISRGYISRRMHNSGDRMILIRGKEMIWWRIYKDVRVIRSHRGNKSKD